MIYITIVQRKAHLFKRNFLLYKRLCNFEGVISSRKAASLSSVEVDGCTSDCAMLLRSGAQSAWHNECTILIYPKTVRSEATE